MAVQQNLYNFNLSQNLAFNQMYKLPHLAVSNVPAQSHWLWCEGRHLFLKMVHFQNYLDRPFKRQTSCFIFGEKNLETKCVIVHNSDLRRVCFCSECNRLKPQYCLQYFDTCNASKTCKVAFIGKLKCLQFR